MLRFGFGFGAYACKWFVACFFWGFGTIALVWLVWVRMLNCVLTFGFVQFAWVV